MRHGEMVTSTGTPANALAMGEDMTPWTVPANSPRQAQDRQQQRAEPQQNGPSCGGFGVSPAADNGFNPTEKAIANISALPTIATTVRSVGQVSPSRRRRSLPWPGSRRTAAARPSRAPASRPAAKVSGMARRKAAEPGDVARARLVIDDAGDHEQRALEQRMRHQIEHCRLDAISEPKPVSRTRSPSEATVV